MALQDALREALRQWDRIVPNLEPVELEALQEIVTSGSGDSGGLADMFLTAFAVMSPALKDIDAVWDELEVSPTRFREPAHDALEAFGPLFFGELGRRVTGAMDGVPRERSAQKASIERAVSERLAALPAVPFAQAPPQALRLVINARLVTPVFQLMENSGSGLLWQMRPVAERVNELLDAASDARGAASWWTSYNPWISTAPADLLGTGGEGEILYAADQLLNDSY
jgi:hypothetical protein